MPSVPMAIPVAALYGCQSAASSLYDVPLMPESASNELNFTVTGPLFQPDGASVSVLGAV